MLEVATTIHSKAEVQETKTNEWTTNRPNASVTVVKKKQKRQGNHKKGKRFLSTRFHTSVIPLKGSGLQKERTNATREWQKGVWETPVKKATKPAVLVDSCQLKVVLDEYGKYQGI